MNAQRSDRISSAIIRLCGYSSIFFVALILLFLAKEGLPALVNVPVKDLFGTRWYPIEGLYGIWPLLLGSVLVTAGAVIVGVPFGIGTAVYLSEVAPPWIRNVFKPIIEILAGLPSVVLGFLGIQIAIPFFRSALNLPTGLTAFTGSVLLGFISIPTIVSIAEDALNTVPPAYRHGALALGSNQWQTIWGVTVPAAKSGLLTAVMLGIGRSLGETMAVMMVTGNAPVIPSNFSAIFEPVRTLTATIASEMGEVATGSEHYQVLFFIGIILFLLSLVINIVASTLTMRAKKRSERLLS